MDGINGKQWFGHPRGLFTLFFTEMWERFSYYGMRAILMLFMITDTAKEGLGISTDTAGAVYGLYTASVYLLTLPGGWIADNVLGQRKSIWYGGICIMIGHMILAIPGSPGIFFSGLAFVAVGTGLLKPNISSIVGDLYPEGGAKRDAGFSLFYMGINIGSIFGQLLVGYFGEKVNWHYGFGLAAIGMLLGLIQYKLTQNHLGEIGFKPKAKEKKENNFSSNLRFGLIFTSVMVLILVILQWTGIIDMFTAQGIAQTAGVIIVTVTLLYFIFIFITGGLSVEEKKRVVVIFFLFLGAAIFWSGFEQAGSTLNIFAYQYSDRFLLGWEVPASWLQVINPAFIVIFAPIIGALWVKLASANLNPNIPVKFAMGLILMAVGFVVMYFAAFVVVNGSNAGMHWLVVTYFLHSIGELTLSPVGLSATTKLAPRKFYSQMMGIWFVGAALGNLIAGLFAGGIDANKPENMPDLFLSVVWLGLGAGVIFLALSPWLKRWSGNVK